MAHCTEMNGKPLAPIDPKNIPPQIDCGANECKDIRAGEFAFDGENIIYGACHISRSYQIVKVEDDCEIPWNAVFPNGKTIIDTAGSYKVKYKWDACCENEPQFSVVSACPCK